MDKVRAGRVGCDDSFRKQMEGYRLTTAEILYKMPDHPNLIQTFVWQHYDLAPKFPELLRFLDYWKNNIEGALHAVYVARKPLIAPTRHNFACGEWELH